MAGKNKSKRAHEKEKRESGGEMYKCASCLI